MTLLIDTGSADIFVNVYTSEFCQTAKCYSNGLFDPSRSTTRAQVNREFKISYEDSSRATGDFITDVLRIGQQLVNNVQIGLALDSTRDEGILGIGYALNEANVIQDGKQVQDTYPTLFERLFSSKLIKIMACSICWENPTSSSLLFGGVDTAKFSGDLITIPIVKENGRYQHLKVELSDLKLPGVRRSQDPSQLSKRLPINVFFDTGAVATYLPFWLVYEVWDAVGAASADDDGFPFVNCDLMKSKLTFDLIFGSTRISIPLSALISAKGGSCIVLVMENSRTSRQDEGVLGTFILSALYIVFDISNHEISLARVKQTKPSRSNVVEYSQYRQKKRSTKNKSLQSFIPEDEADSRDDGGEVAVVPMSLKPSSLSEPNTFAPVPNPEFLNAGVPPTDGNEPVFMRTPPISNSPTSPLSSASSPTLVENLAGAASLNIPSGGTDEFKFKQKDDTSTGLDLSPSSAYSFAVAQSPPNSARPQSYSAELSEFNPLLTTPTTSDSSTANSANLALAIDPNHTPPAQNPTDHSAFLSPSNSDGNAVILDPKLGEGIVAFPGGQNWLQGWNGAVDFPTTNALAFNT